MKQPTRMKFGEMKWGTHYIVRKEDFTKSLTECGTLRGLIVFDDGEMSSGALPDYITDVHMISPNHFEVKCCGEKKHSVILI